MAYGTANSATITTAAKFIPELWSDEVAAAYKGKTVMSNLVRQISFKGKKGDTLHIPVPARSEANAKSANATVSVIADTALEVNLVIDKHYEYSKLYEDMAEVQALNSMRSFYTDDGGYALAKRIDRELHLQGHYLQGGNSTPSTTNAYNTAVIGGDGSTAFAEATPGNGTALTDAGIRRMIQTLEDDDADPASIVIPPVEARILRGISRFTEQAFVGSGDAIKTGRLGNIYGLEVYVSSQCPWIHLQGTDSLLLVNFDGTSLSNAGATTGELHATAVTFTGDTDYQFRVGMILGRDAIALGMQQAIRTQAQYKQEYLGTLVTSDTIFGTKVIRDYAGIAFVVPA